MLGLYLFIFGVIFGGRFGIIQNENYFDFSLALFLGLSLFNVIAEIIAIAPSLIVSQPNFVKKVVFPLEIIPLSKVIASLYYSMFNVSLCIILAPFSHGELTLHVLELPLLIAPLAFIALGLGWAISAIGVFVRDINHVTAFVSTAIMYASAIVYSPNKVPPKIWTILKFNPLLTLIDQSRHIVLWRGNLNYIDTSIIYVISIITLLAGYYTFQVLRPYFAEVV
jgi:lipopolysaccharide transport system permease protein